MKKIARHPFESEFLQEDLQETEKLLTNVLDSATGRAAALSIGLGVARTYAGYLAAAEGNDQELCRALRLGAQTAAAIFALGSGRGEIEFSLGERRVKLPATGPTDATHVGNWRIGWWMAHIVRDNAAIEQLASTPIDVLRRSSSRGDECHYLFVEALQGFENRAPEWSTRLQAAVDATDPAKTPLSDEEFVLNILVPEMKMLFRLALGEIAPFTQALEFALERHNRHWGKGKRKQDPDGFLALGPLAISSLAFDAGMPIDVESEYLPMALVEDVCSNN